MAYNIAYIYQVIDKFTAPLRKITAANTQFNRNMNQSAQSLGKISKGFSSLTNVASAAAGAIGGKIVLDQFVGFETSMNKLESVSFATGGEMAKMRDIAKDLGAKTQFSASEAAQGMIYLKMAGLSTKDVMEAIPQTLQLAAAGGIELGQAADIATNVLGQMGLGVKDLTHVNDVLALAQSKANFSIQELYEAIRPIGTTASNLGIGLEELTAYLGAMANAGEKGSLAGTLLRNAFTELAAPTKDQIKGYKKLGLNLSEFISKSGKITNFKYLLNELRRLNKEGKLSVGALQKLYGDRGFRAIQILAGKAGEGVAQFEEELVKANDTSKRASEIQMKGLPGALKSLKSAFEAVNIAIMESGVDQVIIDISNSITQMARSLSKSSPGMLKFIGLTGLIGTILATVMGALAIVIPLFSSLGTVAAGVFGALAAWSPFLTWLSGAAFPAIGTAIAGLAVPIAVFLAAFAAIGAVVYQVWKNWDYFTTYFKDDLLWMFDNVKAFGKYLLEKLTFLPLVNQIIYLVDLLGKLNEKFSLTKRVAGFFGFGGEKETEKPTETTSIVARNQATQNSNLNGKIVIAPEKGSRVTSAVMETSVPGKLGFNIAGAHP